MTGDFCTGVENGGVKVLLIDDSELVCQRLREALSEIPSVSCVQNCSVPSQALLKVSSYRPDVIVFEIRSTAGFGFGEVEIIRRTFPDTILVMFTQSIFAIYRVRAKQIGVDHFLPKSTGLEPLVQTIANLPRPASIRDQFP